MWNPASRGKKIRSLEYFLQLLRKSEMTDNDRYAT